MQVAALAGMDQLKFPVVDAEVRVVLAPSIPREWSTQLLARTNAMSHDAVPASARILECALSDVTFAWAETNLLSLLVFNM